VLEQQSDVVMPPFSAGCRSVVPISALLLNACRTKLSVCMACLPSPAINNCDVYSVVRCALCHVMASAQSMVEINDDRIIDMEHR